MHVGRESRRPGRLAIRSSQRWTHLAVVVAALALGACGNNTLGSQGSDATSTCARNADCPALHFCLGGMCVQNGDADPFDGYGGKDTTPAADATPVAPDAVPDNSGDANTSDNGPDAALGGDACALSGPCVSGACVGPLKSCRGEARVQT